MRSPIVLLVCLAFGASLGLASAACFEAPLPWVFGPLLGGSLGILASPIALTERKRPDLLSVLVASWMAALPVSMVAGRTQDPALAVLLTATSTAGVFLGLTRLRPTAQNPWRLAIAYALPVLCLILAGMRVKQRQVPDDVPSLIQVLGQDDLELQARALQKLLLHGKDPLLQALKHRSPGVRANAAHGLGLLSDPGAEAALLEATADADPHVRMWSAYSLGEIGSARALPVLERLAQDPEAFVRMNANEALTKLRGR